MGNAGKKPTRSRKAAIGIAIFIGILFGIPLLLEGIGWWPFDPSYTIRGSADSVPEFPNLSEEAILSSLQALVASDSNNGRITTLVLTEAGALKVVKDSSREVAIVPLSKLDRFVTADRRKVEDVWDIGLYCAAYQPCIQTHDSTRPFHTWLFAAQGKENARKALGLMNQLLQRHGAKNTINTRPSLTYIERQYLEVEHRSRDR